MIHVVPTPYWLHLHRRIAAEFQEIDLHVAYTHDVPEQGWQLDLADDVNAITFGEREPWQPKKPLRITIRELRRAGRVIAWLKRIRPAAVVLAGYSDAGRVRLIASCRRRGVPLFLHGDSNVHGDRFTGLRQRVKRFLVRRVVRNCTGVLPFGFAGRKFYLRYGARPEQIFFMPGEPDYSIIGQVTPEQIERARRDFRLPAHRRRIVFSGRLIPLKRVADLIEAFTRVAGARPGWDLTIVGDGPLRAPLEAGVPAHLRERVAWCGFVADPHALAALYRCGDVLALPSDEDAWALVVNEALAAGMTVVLSDVVGAADDLVRDGVSGRLFPRGDVAALADALLDVTDPAHLDAYKAQSAIALRQWRDRGDPVNGLRGALRWIGVLP